MKLPFFLLVGLLLSLFVAQPVHAQYDEAKKDEVKRFSTFDDAIKDLADNIRRELTFADNKVETVRVSGFPGPAGSNAGANVVHVLIEKLKAVGMTVDHAADNNVQGQIRMQREGQGVATLIESTIVDGGNNERFRLMKRIVTDQDTAIRFGALTADFSQASKPAFAHANGNVSTVATAPAGKTAAEIPLTPAETSQQLSRAIEGTSANGTLQKVKVPYNGREQEREFLMVNRESPYGIEILRKDKDNNYVPCKLELKPSGRGGIKAFVAFEKDDRFAVGLLNRSKNRVGCALLLDGIHCFAFSQNADWKKLGKMVLTEPRVYHILGWHDIGKISSEFQITSFPDSAAGKLKVQEGQGTITAIFYEILDEAVQGGAEELGIGIGSKIEQPFVATPGVFFGQPLATITVRYEPPIPKDLPSISLPSTTPSPSGENN